MAYGDRMGLTETINSGKRKFVAWYMYFDDSGKKRFIRGVGSTKELAIARRHKNMAARFAVGLNQPARSTTPKISVFMLEWLNRDDRKLSDESWRKYKRDIEIHVIGQIGDLELEKLTEPLLSELFAIKLADIGDSAKWHVFTNLRSMLNYAVKMKIINTNNLDFVTRPKKTNAVAKFDKKWVNRRISIVKNMLIWMNDKNNQWYEWYPIVSLMCLGFRKSELLGLQWTDITSLDKKGKAKILIGNQLARYEKHTGKQGYYIKESTKTKTEREIPLPEVARKVLLLQKKRNLQANEEWAKNLVFIRPDGEVYKQSYFNKKWLELLTDYWNVGRDEPIEIDKESEYFRPHAMRHVSATMLSKAGVPLEVAQNILGHSSKEMTLHYTQITDATKRKNIDLALEDIL